MGAKRNDQSDIEISRVLLQNDDPVYSAEMGYLYLGRRSGFLYLRGSDGRWYPHNRHGKLLQQHPSYDDIVVDGSHGNYIVKSGGLYGVLTDCNRLMIPVCFLEIETPSVDVYIGKHRLPDGSYCYSYYLGKRWITHSVTKFKSPHVHEFGSARWSGNPRIHFDDNLYVVVHFPSTPYNGEPHMAYWDSYETHLVFLQDISFFQAGDTISVFLRTPSTVYLAVQRGDRFMLLDNQCVPLLSDWVDDLISYNTMELFPTRGDIRTFSLQKSHRNLILVEAAGSFRCVTLPPELVGTTVYQLLRRIRNELRSNRLFLINIQSTHRLKLFAYMLDRSLGNSIYNLTNQIRRWQRDGCDKSPPNQVLRNNMYHYPCPIVIVGKLCAGRLEMDWVYPVLQQMLRMGVPVFLIGDNDYLLSELISRRDISFTQIYLH